MSAWIVSNTSLLRIRAYLLRECSQDGLQRSYGIVGVTGLNQFINDLARMNRYAIWCRYEEKVRMPKLNFDKVVESPTIYQMVKHLHCLSYQCSEGDTETVHKDTWERLHKITQELESNIVYNLPEYKAAAWD